MRKRLTLSDIICALVLFVSIITAALVLMLVPDLFKPTVMVGTEGLEQTQAYCLALLLSHLFTVLMIPAALELIAFIRRKMDGEETITKIFRIPIEIILIIAFLCASPKTTHIQLQSQIASDSSFTLYRTAMLLADIRKDLSEQKTDTQTDIDAQTQSFDYKYTYTTKSGRSSRLQTGHEFEYGICDENKNTIAQITYSEYQSLNNSAFSYRPHTISTYKHSGMIASVDGAKRIAEKKPEDMITLTYDDDTGVIRRELLSEHEDRMPDMYLRGESKTELIGNDNGIKERINGKTVLAFKLLIPGTCKVWVEMMNETGDSIRISNIIEYTQTENLLPTMPVRSNHIEPIETQDSIALT